MTKLSVLLVYGGQSSEHDVSIKSAHNVYAALDDEKYDVYLCYIDRYGKWWLMSAIDSTHTGRPQLFPALGQKQFLVIPGNTSLRIDVVLPILHGRFGEDGTVQGLCELLHLPYVGPSVLAAAVTMDKDMTKRLLQDADVPVVPWRSWKIRNHKPRYQDVVEELGEVVFVKPASAGSSVGVSKVSNAHDWEGVLDKASLHSEVVLIEKAITAREIEVAVLGNDDPRVSGLGEIIPGDEFYSYNDKYSSASTSRTIVPAGIDDEIAKQIHEYALRAYQVTECRGMARVDFFVDDNDSIYLNEINSIPGFTNISMYPKLWQEMGVRYPELIDQLISLALEK
ncbi:MAG: D-alanine--D-alanine ligase family protein [Candidatus Saccharimonadales bacterium]